MTPGQRALCDALAEVPDRAAAAVATWAEPVASGPGAWSAREVVLHLVAVELEVWQPRLAALEAEAFPSWPWVEPGPWIGRGGATCAGAVALFRQARAATVARLRGLDDAGWARRGRHATYGVLDVAALMKVAMDHDAEHVAQIRAG